MRSSSPIAEPEPDERQDRQAADLGVLAREHDLERLGVDALRRDERRKRRCAAGSRACGSSVRATILQARDRVVVERRDLAIQPGQRLEAARGADVRLVLELGKRLLEHLAEEGLGGLERLDVLVRKPAEGARDRGRAPTARGRAARDRRPRAGRRAPLAPAGRAERRRARGREAPGRPPWPRRRGFVACARNGRRSVMTSRRSRRPSARIARPASGPRSAASSTSRSARVDARSSSIDRITGSVTSRAPAVGRLCCAYVAAPPTAGPARRNEFASSRGSPATVRPVLSSGLLPPPGILQHLRRQIQRIRDLDVGDLAVG